MGFIRLFTSAVDPAEVDLIRRAFEADLRPVFERADGCESIELLVSTEANAGGLVDGCILARWTSPDHIERAYEDPDVRAAALKVRNLLRQEPVVRLYEIVG